MAPDVSMIHRLANYASRGLALFASFVYTAAIARILGPADAGIFFLILTIGPAVSMVGRLGTDLYALKDSGRLIEEGRFEAVALYRRCLLGSGVATAVVAAVAIWLVPAVADRQPDAAELLLIATIPFTSVSVLSAAIMRSNRRPAIGAWFEVGLTQALALAISVPLAAHGHASVTVIAVAALAASAITALMSALIVRPLVRNGQGTPKQGLTQVETRQMRRMMIASTLFYLFTWMPVFSLAITSTATQLAYFSVANRLATLLAVVPTLQLTSTLPSMSRMFSDNDYLGLNRTLRTLSLEAMVVAVPAALILIFWPDAIRLIFGSEFSSAGTSLRILGVVQALIVALGPISSLLIIAHRERDSIRFAAISLIVGGAITLVLAHVSGATGAAIGAGCMQVTYAALGTRALGRLGLRPSYIGHWRYSRDRSTTPRIAQD